MIASDIIPHQTVGAIVTNIAQVREEVQHAFTLLLQAQDRLRAVCGDGPTSYQGHLWEHTISDYDLIAVANEIDQFLTSNAWRYILSQTGVTHYMTEARKRELEEQFKKYEWPPLTVENVMSTVQGLTSQVGILLQESAQEVFDWLRPRSSNGVGSLKTNSAFQAGEKVIVGYAVEADWGLDGRGFRLHHWCTSRFRALGNVLSLLDGHGVQRYPNDLVTQLTEGLRKTHAGEAVTTPYLVGKPFKNGRMHLKFQRADLVEKLNQLGGDGTTLRA